MGTMTDARREQVRAALGTGVWDGRTDFDDLKPVMPRRYASQGDMVRIVKGADDLSRPARRSGGVALPALAPVREATCLECNRYPCICVEGVEDKRTPAQVSYMENLISWVAEKDADLGRQARDYTDGMTERGLWEPGRGSNTSRWIDNLKAKLAELKSQPKLAPVVEVDRPGNVEHSELIVRENKSGKPMPQYYALRDEDGTVKFYRVKAGTKPGWWWVEAQASDEFHSIRNVATKNEILRAIIAAGPEESMRLYGREIGSCGRCHRTLTDETSRANGIGPDCEGEL